MKRPLAQVALLYVGGVLLGDSVSLRSPWLFAVALTFAAASFVHAEARVYWLGFLIVLAGWTNMAAHTALLSPFDLRTLVGTSIEYLTLRGVLCETPSQRVYEHHLEESWRTLARVDVAALRRGTDWQAAFGRVAVSTRGVLGTNFFGGRLVEITGVIRPPKVPAAE